jgi:hypothetical protein
MLMMMKGDIEEICGTNFKAAFFHENDFTAFHPSQN